MYTIFHSYVSLPEGKYNKVDTNLNGFNEKEEDAGLPKSHFFVHVSELI